MKKREQPPRHPEVEGGPKYVVQWQTEFDNEYMTPQQAGVEAWRQIREGEGHMHVTDLDTNRQWAIGIRNHELEVIETRPLRWDRAKEKMVKESIRKWDPILQAYIQVEDLEEPDEA